MKKAPIRRLEDTQCPRITEDVVQGHLTDLSTVLPVDATEIRRETRELLFAAWPKEELGGPYGNLVIGTPEAKGSYVRAIQALVGKAVSVFDYLQQHSDPQYQWPYLGEILEELRSIEAISRQTADKILHKEGHPFDLQNALYKPTNSFEFRGQSQVHSIVNVLPRIQSILLFCLYGMKYPKRIRKVLGSLIGALNELTGEHRYDPENMIFRIAGGEDISFADRFASGEESNDPQRRLFGRTLAFGMNDAITHWLRSIKMRDQTGTEYHFAEPGDWDASNDYDYWGAKTAHLSHLGRREFRREVSPSVRQSIVIPGGLSWTNGDKVVHRHYCDERSVYQTVDIGWGFEDNFRGCVTHKTRLNSGSIFCMREYTGMKNGGSQDQLKGRHFTISPSDSKANHAHAWTTWSGLK